MQEVGRLELSRETQVGGQALRAIENNFRHLFVDICATAVFGQSAELEIN